jgi:eukaryotic-like serine/threonine-protein kinase
MTMLGDSVRRRHGRRVARRARSVRRPAWLRWLPIAVAAVALPFIAGYLIAVYVIFPPRAAAVAGIPVPELSGMLAADAERTLTEAGLGPLEVVELPHPERRPGTIVAQTPLPGQQLPAGSTVQVAISSGRPRGVVPDVMGFPAERAETLLMRLGFRVERQFEEADVAEGRVLRVEPRPGSERDLPAAVVIVVSLGPPPPELEPWDEPTDTIARPGGPP